MRTDRSKHKKAYGPQARSVVLVVSIACIVTAAAIAVYVGRFLLNSTTQGNSLLKQEKRAVAAGRADCGNGGNRGAQAAARRQTSARGLLEIPAIGLVAPVRQGISDAVLTDAVGHLPASIWPGVPGTSVLTAHNVTWFSSLDQLGHGDKISYVSGCRKYTYRVTWHRVVRAGYPVYDTPRERIVLVTCYPLNALYPTNSRYLVAGDLTGSTATGRIPRIPADQRLTVPAPRALAVQGLTLKQNEGPVGVLRFAGSPSRAWRETDGPIAAEQAALAAYFGLIRSASESQRAWWADLAPKVPVSAAAGLWGGQISSYRSHLDITLRVQHNRVVAASLTALVTTSASRQPGTYRLRVVETATQRGVLHVAGFTLRLATAPA